MLRQAPFYRVSILSLRDFPSNFVWKYESPSINFCVQAGVTSFISVTQLLFCLQATLLGWQDIWISFFSVFPLLLPERGRLGEIMMAFLKKENQEAEELYLQEKKKFHLDHTQLKMPIWTLDEDLLGAQKFRIKAQREVTQGASIPLRNKVYVS